MNLDFLQSFYWSATLGSFKKAGKKLGKTQPAISRHIKALEKYYRLTLLIRSKAGVVLTPQGRFILDEIAPSIEHILKIKEMGRISGDQPEGELKILTFVGFGSQWLVKFLDGFLEEYPKIKLCIDLKDLANGIAINYEDYDIVIGLHMPERLDFIQRKLVEFKINLYASKEYLKKQGEPKALSELLSHRILSNYSTALHSHLRVPFDWVFYSENSASKKAMQPYLSVNSTTALAKLCADGVGIAPLTEYQREIKANDLIKLFPDKASPEVKICYCYPKKMENVQRITVLYDYLMKRKQDNIDKFTRPS